jgi:hypothetical protein
MITTSRTTFYVYLNFFSLVNKLLKTNLVIETKLLKTNLVIETKLLKQDYQ